MVGLKRRAASSSGAPLPTSRDLDRERRAWLADADALEAAERAVVEAEASIATISDPEDAENWHRQRAERERASIELVHERDRLLAAVESRRERCEALADEIANVPIGKREQVREQRRERIRGYVEELRLEEAALHADDEAITMLREARDEAVAEFSTAANKRARAETEKSLDEQVRWYVRALAGGLPVPDPSPAVRRRIGPALERAKLANRLATSADYSASTAAQAAGIVKLGSDGQSASFPRR